MDEQCFISADHASFAVIFPTTHGRTDSERDVTISDNTLLILTPPCLVGNVDNKSTSIIKMCGNQWILHEYMSK